MGHWEVCLGGGAWAGKFSVPCGPAHRGGGRRGRGAEARTPALLLSGPGRPRALSGAARAPCDCRAQFSLSPKLPEPPGPPHPTCSELGALSLPHQGSQRPGTSSCFSTERGEISQPARWPAHQRQARRFERHPETVHAVSSARTERGLS